MSLINKFCKFYKKNFLISTQYKKIIINLNKKLATNHKIKVLFLIRENSKWSYDKLYRLMKKSSIFEPVIVVSLLTSVVEGTDSTRNNIKESYKFFTNLGYDVVYGFDTLSKTYINLKAYSPDIIFYDQLWELPSLHVPEFVSTFALTCYCSYSFEILDNESDYTSYFHRYLYKYFVEHKYNMQRYEKYKKGNSKNCVVVGYPKLDIYLENKSLDLGSIWKSPEKFKIIYAPHHSFENTGLKFATFKQNGLFILELAKKFSQTTWVFKPHPRFKHALIVNNIMNKEEIEEYYNAWKNIGNIYENGNYFDIFKSSDLMITDCCSFLAEYLPTNKPLLRLCNKDSMKLNNLGTLLTSYCTSIYDNKQLEAVLKKIILHPQVKNNKSIINQVIDFDKCASQKILEYILEDIKRKGK